MPTQELSIALDADLAADVRKSTALEGTSVSAWLARAARNALIQERGLRAIAQREKENGKITDEERRKAATALRAARARSRSR